MADEAHGRPTPGATGELVFGRGDDPRAHVAAITVVDAEPGRRFSFRWVYPEDEVADRGRTRCSSPSLHPVRERHPRAHDRDRVPERGWEVVVLEETYRDHVSGGTTSSPASGDLRDPTGVGPMSVVIDDDLWSAIGDPTRRRLLDLLLVDGVGTATSLSSQAAAGDAPGRDEAPRRARPRRPGARHAGGVNGTTASTRPSSRAAAELDACGVRRVGRPTRAHQADRRVDPAWHVRLTDRDSIRD